MRNKVRTLRRVKLFDHLTLADVVEADRHCIWSDVTAGDAFVHLGDPSNDIFFIVAGEARVLVYGTSGKLLPLRQLQAGDYFGEMSAIDGLGRSASVEAVTACIVARMPSTAFRKLVERDRELNRKLLLLFVTQIRSLTRRVYELGTCDLTGRVVAEFLRQAADCDPDSGSAIIAIPNKTQFAYQLGATRESVSRELRRLVDIGVLEVLDGKSYRCDIKRMQDISGQQPSRGPL